MKRTMGRTLLVVACLLLVGTLLAGPAAAFLEEVYTYEGVLGTINESQITVVNQANVVVPILVPAEMEIPSDYMVGQRVWVELEKADFGMWRLRAIRRLDAGPVVRPATP